MFRLLRKMLIVSIALLQWVLIGNPAMATTSLVSNLPSEADVALAKESSRRLAALDDSAPLRLSILQDPSREGTFDLPPSAVRLLVRILEEMALGNAVTLIPIHAEVTTQEAADILNISRPSLIHLLEEGHIAYRRVGTHRRVRLDSLIAHKRQIEADRRAVLAELAAYDQELGI